MLKRHLRLYEKCHCWLKRLKNGTQSWTKSVIIPRMMHSFSFCPMLWTVRGQTLESVLQNHAELLELWEWSLANDTETWMKGRIIGVNFIMKKFDCYFGCCFISNYKYICLLCEEYTKTIQSYKFVQPNKNMTVSFVVPQN